ncbi:MAG: tail fiber protein [Gallionellaceae bacterium]
MSNYYLGEVRAYPYGFSPRDWILCNGASLAIAEFTPLFAVLGTTYGGDGRVSFKVPNLAPASGGDGRAIMGAGRSPGLQTYPLGYPSGTPTVTLTEAQMPLHEHTVTGIISKKSDLVGTPSDTAQVSRSIDASSNSNVAFSDAAADSTMSAKALSTFGEGGAHENRQPAIGMYFFIAVNGMFPPRN